MHDILSGSIQNNGIGELGLDEGGGQRKEYMIFIHVDISVHVLEACSRVLIRTFFLFCPPNKLNLTFKYKMSIMGKNYNFANLAI